MPRSPNFSFLDRYDPLLLELAANAERFCFSDPTICLIRLRQLTESMALQVVAALGDFPVESQRRDLSDAIRLLESKSALGLDTAQVLHHLRRVGNRAVHENQGSRSDALHALRLAQRAAVWFHRTLGDPKFKNPIFVPPPEPAQASTGLADELKQLREQLAQAQAAAANASSTVNEEKLLREKAEENARKAYADLEAAMSLAEEAEGKLKGNQDRFLLKLEATPPPAAASIETTVKQAQKANSTLADELDESQTRLLIDGQLRAAGWEADSQELRYSKGTRPEAHHYRAIAEWPTTSGPVDYALFHGKTLLGLVEAKRQSKDVPGVLTQTKRYSRDFKLNDAGEYAPGAPWGDHHAPFLFATNGRPYLQQLRTLSGIWFLDTRVKTNQSRPLNGWYSPSGLFAELSTNHSIADANLHHTPNDLPGLRPYQREAIAKTEERIALGQRDLLLAMATGTGKTRTCVSLLYRLIRAKRFRRILFLVDRTELGTQAGEAFTGVKLENLQSFSQIYDVKEIGDARPDEETRVHLATVQGMVKRLLYPSDTQEPFPVDTYDCIIIDECHRGYTLDRELSDDEIGFLDENDYISKYRRVLEHFDAVRIGLTATPAIHTTEIFGKPVFTYSYRQAVIDGHLIDHEPPIRIITELAENGIHWNVGEPLHLLNPSTSTIDLTEAPDEIDMEVEQFNSRVITEPFNRTVCTELARHIDPTLPGKTLIFCANDAHADMVVDLLSQALAARYENVHQDTVAKITGKSDKPGQLIRRYKNEELPKIGVTVDLLTTGIDVPAIINLVFIRRVKSRILYEQMLGRATRLCPDLFGPGEDKEVFHIYDAVDLYATLSAFTEMKPVVSDPQITLRQLVDALLSTSATAASRPYFHDAILARLQRKRSLLRQHNDALAYRADYGADALIEHLRKGGPAASIALFTAKPTLADYIDALRKPGPRAGIPVSHHPDELRCIETGYGTAQKPEDYLESFGAWLQEHIATLPALIVVTQRPRDLTRAQLRELALALDSAGFPETYLRTAWRNARSEDMAAGIVGYIRAQALGSPLVPYSERVDRALKAITHGKKYQWTAPQRKWLERIGRQLHKENVIDRDAFNEGRWRDIGGFDAANRIFDGKLESLLGDLQAEVWRDSA
ncbi:MAG: type I restriction-modification system endonuclease [Opitutaceae bacterium]|nr:type I restriction-modification system endonuclease [Opitutaceae bacterium]